MGVTTTPDGQVVYLPDSILGQPGPELGAPAEVPGYTPPADSGLPAVEPSTGPGLPPSVLSAIGATPSPPQSTALALPDYQAATIDNTPKGNAVRTKQYGQEQKAQQQAAAYAASPEGRIEQGVQAQGQALAGQAGVEQQKADVEGQQSDEVYQLEQDNLRRVNDVYAAKQKEYDEMVKGRDQAQKDVETAKQKWLDYKVDPNRRFKEVGTGRTTLAWIMAALSAVGDALTRREGPNLALQAIMEAQGKDIDLQIQEKQDLGQGVSVARDSLTDYRQRFGDWKEARSIKLGEELEKTAAQTRAIAAKYGGEQAKLRGEEMAKKLEMTAAQLYTSAGEGVFNRLMQQRQMKNTERQTAIAGGHLALANKQYEHQLVMDDAELKLKAAALDGKGDKAGAEQLQKFGVAGVTVKDKDGNELPFIAQGTPEGVEKVREVKAAGTNMVGLIDKALRIRTGWTSDTAKSKEWQELQTIWAAAKGEGKNVLGLGALSESDFELLDKYMGTADPTKFKDPTAGMKQARQNILAKVNSQLHAHGLPDDQNWDIPADKLSAPIDDEQEASYRGLLTSRAGQSLTTGYKFGQIGNPGAPVERLGQSIGDQKIADRTIDTMQAQLNSSDPGLRERALSHLTSLAQSSKSDYVRTKAQQALTANVGGKETQPIGPRTSTAQDTVYVPGGYLGGQ